MSDPDFELTPVPPDFSWQLGVILASLVLIGAALLILALDDFTKG